MAERYKMTVDGPVKEKRVINRKLEGEDRYSARREKFIMLYSDPSSGVYLNGTQAAIAAGYSEVSARNSACTILKDLRSGKGTRLVELIERFGFSKEAWAIKLIRAMHAVNEQGAPTKDAILALRMYANLAGESVADTVAVQNLTVNQQINIPQMVVVGASDERLKLLEAGSHESGEDKELHQETVIEAG